jgi:hypothetical protein
MLFATAANRLRLGLRRLIVSTDGGASQSGPTTTRSAGIRAPEPPSGGTPRPLCPPLLRALVPFTNMLSETAARLAHFQCNIFGFVESAWSLRMRVARIVKTDAFRHFLP